MKTQIILVDDNPLFRQGLKLILENTGKFDVIGEASDEIQLFNILSKIEPELILINLMSSGNEILKIVKKLKIDFSSIPFLIIADGASEFLIHECIINGAKGIIRKEDTPKQFLEAIENIINGEYLLNVPVNLQVNEKSTPPREFIQYYKLKSNKNGFSMLSDREIEVVKLFAEGCSYKTIADQLHISPRTVESHKNNILAKLNLNSIVDLAKFALKHKLIES